MGLQTPWSLSPSKVSAFSDCALAFRFSAIDRLPQAPSAPATKGTLVHAALQRLLARPQGTRSEANALTDLDLAFEALRGHPDYAELGLGDEDEQRFLDQAETLLRGYLRLEDPDSVNWIGLELDLTVEIGNLRLRGIIDRLELDEDGELVVTDYKTGKVPSQQYERSSLGGVHFYAFMCEQLFGRRPAKVQLYYVSEPVAIVTTPTEQSTRGLERKVRAVWQAVERACERDDFRPKPPRLCDWCSFQAYCPTYGGDPQQAREVAAALRSGGRVDPNQASLALSVPA